jgi:hypothetical protein
MGVYVFFVIMSQVFVLMRPVLAGMLMVMHMGVTGMGVLMGMFMDMLVRVGVRMLMQVNFIPMPVLMAVYVRVFMGVQMHVFVFALHGGLLRQKFSFP